MHEPAILQHTQNFACVSMVIVPISSRKSVPPSATSKRPFLDATALVNAPLTWPKSVDSRRSGGVDPGIDRDKRPVASRRVQVNRLRDKLFSRTALALNQNRRAAGRDLRNEVKDLKHRLALADDVFEVVALLEGAFS